LNSNFGFGASRAAPFALRQARLEFQSFPGGFRMPAGLQSAGKMSFSLL
jgi:hypothetical protein